MHTCSPRLGICPHSAHQAHGERTACGKRRQNPPHPPDVGLSRTRAPPTRQSQPSVAVRGAVLSGGLGGSSGQHPDWTALRPGSPSALCRGPHHRRETQATITNPTNFSPNLSQRRIPPGPRGFDDRGLMGSHRKAHKKRHRVKTGSLWEGNKSPATHDTAQLPDQSACGQQRDSPTDRRGPVLRSDDLSPHSRGDSAGGVKQRPLRWGRACIPRPLRWGRACIPRAPVSSQRPCKRGAGGSEAERDRRC